MYIPRIDIDWLKGLWAESGWIVDHVNNQKWGCFQIDKQNWSTVVRGHRKTIYREQNTHRQLWFGSWPIKSGILLFSYYRGQMVNGSFSNSSVASDAWMPHRGTALTRCMQEKVFLSYSDGLLVRTDAKQGLSDDLVNGFGLTLP